MQKQKNNESVYAAVFGEKEVAKSIATELRRAKITVKWVSLPTLAKLKTALSDHRIDLLYCAEKHLQSVCPITKQAKANLVSVIALVNQDSSPAKAMALGARDQVDYQNTEHLLLVSGREIETLRYYQSISQYQAQLNKCEQHYHYLMERSHEAIAYIHDGIHIHANYSYANLFGFDEKEDIEGLPILDLINIDQHAQFKKRLAAHTKKPTTQTTLNTVCERYDGTQFKADIELFPAHIEHIDCTGLVIRDQATQATPKPENGLDIMRLHEPVTGLYNRQAFIEELEQVITGLPKNSTGGAVFYIQIDHFDFLKRKTNANEVNDLITHLGKLITQNTQNNDFIARFGECIFTILVRDDNQQSVTKKSQALIKALNRKIDLGRLSLPVTASLGISYINSASVTPYDLLAYTSAACGCAMKKGGNQVVCYSDTQQVKQKKALKNNLHWVNLLKNSLEKNQFKLFFQPMVDLKTNDAESYEVMLCLYDEKNNKIPANKFLPAAEQTGMSSMIDRWTISRALYLLQKKQDAGNQANLFIKLSSFSYSDKKLLRWIYERSKLSGIQANNLVFEVHEEELTTQPNEVTSFARMMKKIKCQIAITQISHAKTLSLCKNLPIDFIKINPEIINQLNDHIEQISAIVGQARNMECKVIATHVNNAEDMLSLYNIGLDFIQGDFLQEPDVVMQFDYDSSAGHSIQLSNNLRAV